MPVTNIGSPQGRCTGGEDLFAHKKEFGTIVPYAGQPVSFLVEATEKGAAAKKIREEESVPELPISDEGRTFGTIRDFNTEKGYGFVIPRNGGDNARFFDKACKNMTPGKGMCVSFVLEETEKGPTAKDLREEDPERVARVTAKVHYGKVKVGPAVLGTRYTLLTLTSNTSILLIKSQQMATDLSNLAMHLPTALLRSQYSWLTHKHHYHN